MTGRKLEVIKTEDGSHSLYVPELKETYHSFHGAVQESRHVFIHHGLDFFVAGHRGKARVKVLELGLGTGLNALLVAEWSARNNIAVAMESLEAYPVEAEMALGLNYASFIGNDAAEAWFKAIHQTAWGIENEIHGAFRLKKLEAMIENTLLPGDFNVIFFDAFAPSKQAELWALPILEKAYEALGPAGVFVTYCAKGQLKRDLKAIGFVVETLAGAPGKKEMVRGVKP